jgi:hypothetical protein
MAHRTHKLQKFSSVQHPPCTLEFHFMDECDINITPAEKLTIHNNPTSNPETITKIWSKKKSS